jgi:hypothetical protein
MRGMTLLSDHSLTHSFFAFCLLLVPEEMDFAVSDIGHTGHVCLGSEGLVVCPSVGRCLVSEKETWLAVSGVYTF